MPGVRATKGAPDGSAAGAGKADEAGLAAVAHGAADVAILFFALEGLAFVVLLFAAGDA
jgi:hypothetical protein